MGKGDRFFQQTKFSKASNERPLWRKDMDNLKSLLLKAKEASAKEILDNSKRKYTSNLKNIKFKDDERFEIKEGDSELLILLKNTLRNTQLTYGDFITPESKITYSAFYSLNKNQKITWEMFKRFMDILDLEIEITVKRKD